MESLDIIGRREELGTLLAAIQARARRRAAVPQRLRLAGTLYHAAQPHAHP